MPAPYAHGVTVTVQRKVPGTDRYGNEIAASWSTVGTIDGCGIAPRESTEDNQRRAAVVIGLTVFAPYGADVQAGDRCVVNGRTYAVDGDPADWAHPMTGWKPGTVIQLTTVEG